MPLTERHSHGDSNVTGGAAAMQRNATAAIVNVVACLIASFISVCHCRVESKTGTIHRVKDRNMTAESVGGHSGRR
jgi:hypothetical protein